MNNYNHNEGPERLERIRIIRVHINDWVASTRGLSLEEEGFFWRFTLLQYDRMGSVVDDDMLNSRALNLDLRVYRRLKDKLVAAGKIRIQSNMLTHPRIEREIEMYVAEYRRRSEAAKDREQRRATGRVVEEMWDTSSLDAANFPDNSAGSPAEVQEKFAGSPPELTPHLSEIDNENNGCTATTVTTSDPRPSRARAFPKPKPSSKKDPPKPPKGGGADLIAQAFEEFWLAFPGDRKRGKGTALDAFRRIVTDRHRKKLHAKASELVDGAKRYAASKYDPEYVPMPETWLNGGRWMDDLQPAAAAKPAWWANAEAVAKIPDAKWKSGIDKYANGHWPVDKLGPVPGAPQCAVPQRIVSELRLTERYGLDGLERPTWKGGE
jgi:uncharacterized protein YdaU (DUF1376 family)